MTLQLISEASEGPHWSPQERVGWSQAHSDLNPIKGLMVAIAQTQPIYQHGTVNFTSTQAIQPFAGGKPQAGCASSVGFHLESTMTMTCRMASLVTEENETL